MPDGAPDGDAAAGPLAPARLRRATPCVGVCSTTYGDLVCRGCKRFAHEIVAWNGYAQSQREAVWRRLARLLAESVRAHVRISDAARLRAAAREAGATEDSTPEALALAAMRVRPGPLAALGLTPTHAATTETAPAARAIDREFYLRSQAHYEASFKTLV